MRELNRRDLENARRGPRWWQISRGLDQRSYITWQAIAAIFAACIGGVLGVTMLVSSRYLVGSFLTGIALFCGVVGVTARRRRIDN
jgi:hypothetical protein